MRLRTLSIAFGLTIIATLLAVIPVTQTRLGIAPSFAYAFTCPDQSTGTANSDGTFTCQTQIGEGTFQTQIYNANGSLANVGNTNVAGGGQINTSNDPSGPVKCNGWTNFFSNTSVCIGRSISAFIGTALITVTAWLLQIAGLIFNYLMYYTVIAFGDATNGFLTTGVLNAINLTWSAFRDISNIVIIGLFTFIAISIILGLNQFGSKKLIARVLIVAILINFSLLFTKIVIDFSNFSSYVFYQSMPTVQIDTQSSSGFTQDGVAGKFIRFLGVTSVSDTFATLKQGADNADSGWIILLHGLFGATLLLLAAVALIYGSFLLTVRAVVLVFLLITSSFAFATYLIPKLSESSYGWNAWWKALFQNAIFAPLLMALLWATLVLAAALRPAGGTLGGLLTDPTNTTNLSALFSYVIVLGFLIASFKVSSSFASSISGFSFAALNIARLGVAPLALGSRFLAPALRNTVGRNSAAESKALAAEISREASAAARARSRGDSFDTSKLAKLIKDKESADARAKRDFNFMNTSTGKQIAQAAGLSGFLAGEKKVGGFVGPRKTTAEEAAKKAGDAGVSADVKKEIAGTIAESMKAEQGFARKANEDLQRAASAQVESAKATASAAKQAEQLARKQAEAQRQLVEATAEQELIKERHRNGSISKAQHDDEMRAQDSRIKEARDIIEGTHLRSQEIDNLHLAGPLEKLREVRDAGRKLDTDLQEFVQKKVADIEQGIKSDVAIELAHHPDDYTATQIREDIGKQTKNKRLKEFAKAFSEVSAEAGEGGPPKPPTIT